MNKKYIKYLILAAVIIIAVFIYLFVTLNPTRKEIVQNTLQNLFPFGEPQQGNIITGETPTGEPIVIDQDTGEVITQDTPQVRQITDFSIAGFQPLTTQVNEQVTRTVVGDDGVEVQRTETVRRNIHTVRYARTNDSYVFDTVVDAGLSTEQLTNGFIPNSQEAFFSKDLSKIVLRSFNTETRSIRTYYGSLDKIPVVPEACPFDFPTSVKFQDTNDAVANIQRFLNGFLGFTISETGENSPGNETGVFDELTRQAVIRFQESRNITADGNVGPLTRQQLSAACMEVQTQKAEQDFKINNPFTYRMTGVFGQDNIITMSDTADATVAYILKQATNSITFLRNLATDTARQVYDSPFSEWLVQPIGTDRVFLTTKASQNVPGYLYELNTSNNTFKKILGDIDGLTTTVSPNGAFVLYSGSTETGFNLGIYNIETGIGTRLGITTLPEKCGWNNTSTAIYCAIPDSIPENSYPDAWYQGIVGFSDSIWSINPSTGATNRIINLDDYSGGNGIDISRIKISDADRYLYFTNKFDGTLWVVDLLQ